MPAATRRSKASGRDCRRQPRAGLMHRSPGGTGFVTHHLRDPKANRLPRAGGEATGQPAGCLQCGLSGVRAEQRPDRDQDVRRFAWNLWSRTIRRSICAHSAPVMVVVESLIRLMTWPVVLAMCTVTLFPCHADDSPNSWRGHDGGLECCWPHGYRLPQCAATWPARGVSSPFQRGWSRRFASVNAASRPGSAMSGPQCG